MLVRTIVGCFNAGVGDMLEAVGKFILALVSKTQPEADQAAKLEGG